MTLAEVSASIDSLGFDSRKAWAIATDNVGVCKPSWHPKLDVVWKRIQTVACTDRGSILAEPV